MNTKWIDEARSALAELRALIGHSDQHQPHSVEQKLLANLLALENALITATAEMREQDGIICELEETIGALQKGGAHKEELDLVRVGCVGEFHAYLPRPGTKLAHGMGGVKRYFCQACLEGGQHISLIGNGSGYWSCPVCKSGAMTEIDTFDYRIGKRLDL